MKLKNNLPLFIFGSIIILMVLYTFKDQKKSNFLEKNNYEFSFENENIQNNSLQNKYTKNKHMKKEAAKKISDYKLFINKKKSSTKFTNTLVKETPQSEKENTQNTANNDEDKDKKEKKKENKKSEVAKDSFSNKTNKLKTDSKDFESIQASSYDEPIFIETNSNFLNKPNREKLKNTDNDSKNFAQSRQGLNKNVDDNNEDLGTVDLSQLPELIKKSRFEEIQLLINSSSLSTFRRKALQMLVTNSSDTENSEQIKSIITKTYFTPQHLALFTESMVEDDSYSVQEKTYMGTLILQNLAEAPKSMSETEFVDLYFNGIKTLLSTPESINNSELTELYLAIDYSIEENFHSLVQTHSSQQVSKL